MFLWREGASVMPILGGWGEGKDAVFYQQGRGWVLFPSLLILCLIYPTLRYYLMNHPEKFVQGYSVMTTQYRYTEYVGLTEWVSNKSLQLHFIHKHKISKRATSAETEEQQPNWGDVHDWGELYDLEADPQVLRTRWKSETLVRRTSTFTATTTTWTSRCRWGSCCTRDGTTTINLLAHAQSFEGKLTFLVKWRLLPWNRYWNHLCLLLIIVFVFKTNWANTNNRNKIIQDFFQGDEWFKLISYIFTEFSQVMINMKSLWELVTNDLILGYFF